MQWGCLSMLVEGELGGNLFYLRHLARKPLQERPMAPADSNAVFCRAPGRGGEDPGHPRLLRYPANVPPSSQGASPAVQKRCEQPFSKAVRVPLGACSF